MNKQELKKTLVVVGLTSAIAFSVIRLYRTYKTIKEESISASDRVDKALAKKQVDDAESKEEYMVDDDVLDHDPNYSYYYDPEDVYEGHEYVEMEEESETEVIFEEEVNVLNYEPHSPEAWDQYVRMSLAELNGTNDYDIMVRLFSAAYIPQNERDSHLLASIQEDREEFFGEGFAPLREASMAELIVYFARLIDFDIDGGIAYWTGHILRHLGVTLGMGGLAFENLIESVLNHSYVSADGFGLFGMSQEDYMVMIHQIDSRKSGYISFMDEYNAFIEEAINYDSEE